MTMLTHNRCVIFVFFTLLIASSGCQMNTKELDKAEFAIGQLAFNDATLSASGKVSCASCHSPSAGFSAPNALAFQPGGKYLEAHGLRASQPLGYLVYNTAFHWDEKGTPTGGFFWDGRANSLAEQAMGPLLGEREMANPDKSSVVQKISQSQWADLFKKTYGANILNDVDAAFLKLTQAVETFQKNSPLLNAFSSKYDAYLRGEIQLEAAEARGLALFNDEEKGNCASCHPSDKDKKGRHPLFTDFTYDNLGVPRNLEIIENNNPKYFDLGLCDKPDLKERKDLCGAFKVPTLRNAGVRQVYFHNGKFKSLKDALTFYVQRDTHPEKWYPKDANGKVLKFDDLPIAFHANVNVKEVPYQKKKGEQPTLNDQEIDDVIAFIHTLTDGWKDQTRR
jgi:cytochrome c peroxidase